jgi:hypothetical protein
MFKAKPNKKVARRQAKAQFKASQRKALDQVEAKRVAMEKKIKDSDEEWDFVPKPSTLVKASGQADEKLELSTKQLTLGEIVEGFETMSAGVRAFIDHEFKKELLLSLETIYGKKATEEVKDWAPLLKVWHCYNGALAQNYTKTFINILSAVKDKKIEESRVDSSASATQNVTLSDTQKDVQSSTLSSSSPFSQQKALTEMDLH